jgi:hypothetical protein
MKCYAEINKINYGVVSKIEFNNFADAEKYAIELNKQTSSTGLYVTINFEKK